jgi:hypothetical protein
MNTWKWLTTAEAVMIVGLLLCLGFRRHESRFQPLGNHDGDGWYMMTDRKTGQVCFGGPVRPYEGSGDVFEKVKWEQTYKGTGMPYCKELR